MCASYAHHMGPLAPIAFPSLRIFSSRMRTVTISSRFCRITSPRTCRLREPIGRQHGVAVALLMRRQYGAAASTWLCGVTTALRRHGVSISVGVVGRVRGPSAAAGGFLTSAASPSAVHTRAHQCIYARVYEYLCTCVHIYACTCICAPPRIMAANRDRQSRTQDRHGLEHAGRAWRQYCGCTTAVLRRLYGTSVAAVPRLYYGCTTAVGRHLCGVYTGLAVDQRSLPVCLRVVRRIVRIVRADSEDSAS